jgi:hypothetical protein
MRARPHGRVGRLRAHLSVSRRQIGLPPTCRRNRAAGPSGAKLHRPARENGMHCASTHSAICVQDTDSPTLPVNPEVPAHSANPAFCILHFAFCISVGCSYMPHCAPECPTVPSGPTVGRLPQARGTPLADHSANRPATWRNGPRSQTVSTQWLGTRPGPFRQFATLSGPGSPGLDRGVPTTRLPPAFAAEIGPAPKSSSL